MTDRPRSGAGISLAGRRLQRSTGVLAWVVSSVIAASAAPLAFGASAAPAVSDIGSYRQLFVDGSMAAELTGGAELRLHHPVPQEVSRTNFSWQGNSQSPGSVFRDGSIYRRYLFGGYVKNDPADKGELVGTRYLTYEESDDGITWRQPILGLVEYEGSKANNIVLTGGPIGTWAGITPMPTIFRDTNPNAAPDARYKAIFWSNKPKGLVPFKSPDGLHWAPLTNEPVNLKKVGASMNLAFWDSLHHEYRAYFRSHIPVDANASRTDEARSIDPPKGFRRDIRTATSPDLITWSEPTDLDYTDPSTEQLYDNVTMPYERAPQYYIGFPGRYVERPWSDSLKALPDTAARERRSRVEPRFGTAMTEGLVMASRDGVHFKRWNDAFLRPGIERPGTWCYGHQFIGWHPIITRSALPGAPDELSFYTAENKWISTGATIRRYTLRFDGFVSVQAPLTGGEVVTPLLRFTGNRLELNFSTSAVGGIRVAVEDADGHPLHGFSLENCPVVFGDTVGRAVTWNGNPDIGALAGRPIRLRFELRDADLYAFKFTD